MEIVASLPGYISLWEPLHLNGNPKAREYGFSWQTWIPENAKDDLKKEYIEKILTGKAISLDLISHPHFYPSQYLKFRGFLTKFTNANLLLAWMLKNFPLRTILMIRHPCAVVSSQMKHWAWENFNKKSLVFPKEIETKYPHLLDVYNRVASKEESLAFEWAVQTYVPLKQPKPHPWFLTTYERMVLEGEDEIRRIFAYLEENIPVKSSASLLQIPSATTNKKSYFAKHGNPLIGWQKHLTTKQIDKILQVVHAVGVDFYSDALEPDCAKLGLN